VQFTEGRTLRRRLRVWSEFVTIASEVSTRTAAAGIGGPDPFPPPGAVRTRNHTSLSSGSAWTVASAAKLIFGRARSLSNPSLPPPINLDQRAVSPSPLSQEPIGEPDDTALEGGRPDRSHGQCDVHYHGGDLLPTSSEIIFIGFEFIGTIISAAVASVLSTKLP